MPVYRTPSGRIIEERTDVSPPRPGDEKSAPVDPTRAKRAGGGASANRGERTTVVGPPTSGTGKTRTTADPGGANNEPTRLVGAIPGVDESENVDPVVGWLVVVDGPGRGRDLRVGSGRNAIGRAGKNRIVLPFGDTQISRRAHLWVTYDPRNRRFSIAPGDGSNLAYLDDTAIEQRMDLVDGATIHHWPDEAALRRILWR